MEEERESIWKLDVNISKIKTTRWKHEYWRRKTEKLKLESEKKGIEYKIKLNQPGNAFRNIGKLLANSAYG